MRNTPLRSLMWLPLLAVLSVLPGCIVHGEDDWYDDYDDDICYCASDRDCSTGESCRGGVCRVVPPGSGECSSSRDCPGSQVCINSVCSQFCARDSDCGAGQRCSDNFCVANGATDGGTRPDAGSDGGTRPDSGTDGGTRPDAGSDGGTRPDAGVDAGSPQQCRVNMDCGAGNYCINNQCIRGCYDDTWCNATDTCVSGLCRPRPVDPNACTTAADCTGGKDCVDGQCRASCDSTTQCPDNYSCQIGYCMPIPDGGRSRANCECPAGQVCFNGQCKSPQPDPGQTSAWPTATAPRATSAPTATASRRPRPSAAGRGHGPGLPGQLRLPVGPGLLQRPVQGARAAAGAGFRDVHPGVPRQLRVPVRSGLHGWHLQARQHGQRQHLPGQLRVPRWRALPRQRLLAVVRTDARVKGAHHAPAAVDLLALEVLGDGVEG